MDRRSAGAALAVVAALLLQMTPHFVPRRVRFDLQTSPYDVEASFGGSFRSYPQIQGSTARPASAAGLSQVPAAAAATVYLPLALALGRPYFDLPGPFELSAEFVLGGPATSVDVVDGVAFAGIGAHLVALDVSGDGDPTALGASPPLPGTVMDVAVQDGLAFVAVHQPTPLDDTPGGLFVLDVRRIESIEIVGHGAIHGGATRFAVEGDRAILVAPDEAESESEGAGTWIHEFDVADADAPSEIGRTRIVGELSDIEIAGGSFFACIDGDLHWSDLGEHPLDAVITAPPAPCSALATTPDGRQLAVASDHAVEESPMLRTFGVGGTRDLSPTAIVDLNVDIRTIGRLVNVSDVSLRENVAAVVGWSRNGGLVWDIRSSSPFSTTVEVKRTVESLSYGVDLTDDSIVTASATDGSPTYENSLAIIGAGLDHVLGGEIGIWRRGEDGSIGDTSDGRHQVPGTLTSVLQTDGQSIFVQEHISCGVSISEGVPSICLSYEVGRVWILDRTTGVHNPIGPFPSRLSSHNSLPRASAVSENGVFISDDWETDIFDLRRSPPVLVASVPFGGAVAADGDTLVVSTYDETVHVFDVSDLSDPILQSSFETPRDLGVDYPVLGLSEGWLWLSVEELSLSGLLMTLFSVHDPVHPKLVATWLIEPEEVELGSVSAMVARGDQAIVAGYDGGVTRLLTFRASSTEHLPPVIWRETISPYMDLGRFWLASDDDRLWLWGASATLLPSGLWDSDYLLVEADTSHLPYLRLARSWSLPSAVTARTTANIEEHSGDFLPLSLRAAGGLVVGSTIGGGVFGFEP